jgi:hypothetical protein
VARLNRQAEQETPEEEQDPELLSIYPDTEGDSYEPNDTSTQATSISPAQNGEPTNYTVSIQATLHRHVNILGGTQSVDVDYFYFNVFGTANITITLDNIPAFREYFFEIKKSNNIKYASTDLSSVWSTDTFADPLAVSLQNASSGSYFIRVYSGSSQTYSSSLFYYLSVSVSYVHSNETIANARFNKGCKALLWKSDFDPAGIAPFSISDREQVGSYNAFNNLNENRLMNALRTEANGARIPQAILLCLER